MKKNLLLFAILFICLLSKAATNKNNQVNFKNPIFESIILNKNIFEPLKNPTTFYSKTLIDCSVTLGGGVSNGNTSISWTISSSAETCEIAYKNAQKANELIRSAVKKILCEE